LVASNSISVWILYKLGSKCRRTPERFSARTEIRGVYQLVLIKGITWFNMKKNNGGVFL